ncbi:MAG: thiol-activated cytolysin family protein [Trueperaceae bacterium]|nr:thiol-activated cytolysin family protein [Trueperaceae bacterium]
MSKKATLRPSCLSRWLLLISLVVSLAACSSSGGGVKVSDVNGFLTTLPSWTDFSPPQETQVAAPSGEASLKASVKLSTPSKDEDGNVIRDETTGEPLKFEDVTYTCTETPYSLTSNPEKIVMYNPDASILWPGSLIQGKSYADGVGSLLGLTIAERAPIQVAITDFFNDNPAQVVENPSLVTVTKAIGDMVGDAAAENLDTPSSIQFNIETYHSDSDFAASFKLSGKYLGFSGSASGEKTKKESETTVAVHFYQQMFTVSVAPPQTPGGFFSDAFTAAKLQEQVNLGRIGPSNLPVYLSEVVYGRMMMFTMTSTASEDELRGTINAAYNSIGTSVSGSLSASQKNILEKSKIAITSYGGPADATIAMIRSGDWSQYFTKRAALTTAKPLSYVFRNLGDGSIAKVSEAGTFNLKECSAKISTPGTFDFGLVQKTENMPISTPYEPLIGDFNGDDRADLLLNHKGSDNELVLAFGNQKGNFDFLNASTGDFLYFAKHPEKAAEGWGNYETRILDLNGDSCDDVIWNVHISGANKTYAGIAQLDGGCGSGDFTGFDFTDVSPHSNSNASGWERYDLLTMDVNGDDKDDLVWNFTEANNRTYVGLSKGDGSFESLPFQDRAEGGWTPYNVSVANVNGDSYADLIWDSGDAAGAKRVYTALGQADGSFNFRPFKDYSFSYDLVVANINSDVFSDIVSSGLRFDRGEAQVGYGQGKDSDYTLSSVIRNTATDVVWGTYKNNLGDVNGDGRDDLIWTGPGGAPTNLNVKSIYIGLGTDDSVHPIDFSRVKQDHPQVLNWTNYDTLVGDVDGDGLDDIIWVRAEGKINRVFIGLAKNED